MISAVKAAVRIPVAVKLSHWPDPLSQPLLRPTLEAVRAIIDALSG